MTMDREKRESKSEPQTKKPGREISGDSFEARAEAPPPGLLRELWEFVREHKKWWLIPIILCLLALGALIFLGSSGAGPFIYTIF